MADNDKEVVDYQKVLTDLEAKKAAIEAAITGVKSMLGQSASSPSFVGSSSLAPETTTHLRFDTFFGMTVSEAAKKYLSMSKRTPRSTQEIVDALNQGGCKAVYSTVSSQLSRRSAEGTFVAPNRGKWGLAEWYGGTMRRKNRSGNSQDEGKVESKKDE